MVACLATASPASALVIQPVTSLQQQIKQDSPVIDVVVHGGGAARRTYTDPSRTQSFWDVCPQ